MFTITAAELMLALSTLPNPNDVPTSCITVPIPISQGLGFFTPRTLTFRKCALRKGIDDPWHNEWMLEHPPRPAPALTGEESIIRHPFFGNPNKAEGPIVEDDAWSVSNPKELNTMDIMSDAEFGHTIDAMTEAEQQILLNITSTLVDQMEINTAEIVSRWCTERIWKEEAYLAGDDTGESLPEFDAEERISLIDKEWLAKVHAAVDIMIETVTDGDASGMGWECALQEAAQLIVPHLDMVACIEIGDQCRARHEALYKETVKRELHFKPARIQDAADARGELGPLDTAP